MAKLDRKALLDRLERALLERSDRPGTVRVEVPLEDIEPAAWLQTQRAAAKTYWANRDGAFEAAGLGEAHCVTADGPSDAVALFAGLRSGLSGAHPDLRYYGGMTFDAACPDAPPWRAFGACRFIIPRFEVVGTQGRTYFACNTRIGRDERPGEELDAVRTALEALEFGRPPSVDRLPEVLSRCDRPDRDAWDRLVRDALDRIAAGALDKVVLARETRLEFSEALDPLAVLRRVKATGAHAYLFCFQPSGSSAFLGVSPERLYQCDGREVRSEALAGTRPRGAWPGADAALGAELLHSDKELREHRFVMDCIRGVLDGRCQDVRCDDGLSLVKLPNCQHLVWRCEGRLAEGRCDADLLHALHPTPAVGGYPAEAACAWIRASEPFARGWYAGPVGWVGCNGSEFAIGIRSGLTAGRELRLYTGAGIVSGATPDQEWDEIETKMAGLLNALTCHDQ